MPRGDRTGPDGMGPLTGRRAGFCAGYQQPGHSNPTNGYGNFRGGRGRGGRGYRNQFYMTGFPAGWQQFNAGYQGAPWSKEQELAMLSAQSANLEEQLSILRKRQEELHSDT